VVNKNTAKYVFSRDVRFPGDCDTSQIQRCTELCRQLHACVSTPTEYFHTNKYNHAVTPIRTRAIPSEISTIFSNDSNAASRIFVNFRFAENKNRKSHRNFHRNTNTTTATVVGVRSRD